MLIGLGTGSVGTAELAKRLGLPHERHWLPWDPDESKLDAVLPEIVASGGEVGLYFLPYVEPILRRIPEARFVCMQRDPGRVVRGLVRKLGRNPFAVPEDAAAFDHGFPWYGGVTLEEGAGRFYRDYYERAYALQRRHPEAFRVFLTDHLLGAEVPDVSPTALQRLADLVQVAREDFTAFVGERGIREMQERGVA